jgi:predicted CXXCH cytochrome family protein
LPECFILLSSRSWRSSLRSAAALAVLLVCGRAASAQPAAGGAAVNTCASCHVALPDAKFSAPPAAFAQQDIHRESGFTCSDCHGGDRTATDKLKAHDASKGFKGAPAGQTQITVCARCHSDADVMRKYAPRQRVDQAAEYATSVHGKQLATGDTRVATCVNCHGAHGIRRVNDAKSPVFPTNVAATCGACHASATHMAGYTLPNRKPLPTDQLSLYQQSVHYAALTKGNDLSAPTCNDCHGNHGAAPPGAGSVVNVCGTCHAVFAQKFSTSVHAQIFDRGCVECHSNHAVKQPSDAMLGSDAQSLCATCHSGADDKGVIAATRMRADIERLKTGLERSNATVSALANAGMEMSAQALAVGNARTRLTLARTEMHTFDAAHVTPVIAEGLGTLKDVDKASDTATAELRFRRRGLAVSLGAILLVVIALGFKIRQLERRPSKHLIQ